VAKSGWNKTCKSAREVHPPPNVGVFPEEHSQAARPAPAPQATITTPSSHPAAVALRSHSQTSDLVLLMLSLVLALASTKSSDPFVAYPCLGAALVCFLCLCVTYKAPRLWRLTARVIGIALLLMVGWRVGIHDHYYEMNRSRAAQFISVLPFPGSYKVRLGCFAGADCLRLRR
jgi:hypothetical protein